MRHARGCDATTEQGLLREIEELKLKEEVARLKRLLEEMKLDEEIARQRHEWKMWKREKDHAIWLAEREHDAPSSSATMAAGEDPPQTRENAREGAQGQGQEPLSGKKQPPPRSGEAAQEPGEKEESEKEKRDGRHSVWGRQDNIILPAPERKPPDSHTEKDTRTPETEGGLKPRTAPKVGRTRKERGSGGWTRVVGWGPARRLLWRTRTKRARVKEKHRETAGTGGWELMTGKFFCFLNDLVLELT